MRFLDAEEASLWWPSATGDVMAGVAPSPNRFWTGPVSSKWFDGGWTDRTLSLFTQVEAGEGIGALLLAANVFFLLTAYYILKTVREALILSERGAEVKAYAAAGQAALLLAVVPVYGWAAGRLTRFRLGAAVMLFFLSNLPAFYVLDASGIPIGVPFYLWLGIFNLMAVAQFWAFANDLYTEEQGRRLFPVLGVGSSVGALVGAHVAGRYFGSLGIEHLLLAAGGLISASLFTGWYVNQRACAACPGQRANAQTRLGSRGAFNFVFTNRYLRLIAIMVVLLKVVNTGGEYLLSKLVVREAAQAAVGAADPVAVRQAFIGQFYGNYFTWVGIGGLALQLFLVSRLFRWIGVRGALFLLPAIAMGGYGLLAAVPILAVAFTTKGLENSTDYSVENTARQALFLSVSRDAKYKAKTAIDTFFYRAGDMKQAGVVWLGSSLAFTMRDYALANVAFVVCWFAVTISIARTGSAEETSANISGDTHSYHI